MEKKTIILTRKIQVYFDCAKDAEGILNTSRMNTTYRVLSSKLLGKMPSEIFSNLNNSLTGCF